VFKRKGLRRRIFGPWKEEPNGKMKDITYEKPCNCYCSVSSSRIRMMKENGLVMTGACMERRKMHTKFAVKRKLRIFRRRWEGDIKIDLK
jgi:hypothetical protein